MGTGTVRVTVFSVRAGAVRPALRPHQLLERRVVTEPQYPTCTFNSSKKSCTTTGALLGIAMLIFMAQPPGTEVGRYRLGSIT